MTVAWPLFALSWIGSYRDRHEPVSLYVDRPPTAAESAQNQTSAKYEPAWGCYLGAYTDQDNTIRRVYRDQADRLHRLPQDFEAVTGKAHATYFFYMGYGMPVAMDWLKRLDSLGKIVHIALEPNRGLESVQDDSYLRTIADELRESKAKVFLRFASEMNGNWVAYSQDPELYKEKFRLVSRIMKERAPNVAMVWCPYTSPETTLPDYYPGDEWVDWVGVNMYNVTYFDQDMKRPAWKVQPTDMLDQVYDLYSLRKPIMIAEYGVTHYSAVEDEFKTGYAVRCIKSLYRALPRRYPRVKAINYFNANNMKMRHRQNNDYSLTTDQRVLSAYSSSTGDGWFLSGPESAAPPALALPVTEGQVLSGLVRVSAWARSHELTVSVRFRLDGGVFWQSPDPGDWETTLDLREHKPGPATLTVEAFTPEGPVGSKSVRVLIQN